METSKLMEYFQKKGLTESQQKEVHTPEGEIKIYCYVMFV